MAQGAEFPLRKPPGFHYDFFLLGITTFLAGLLGVPAPNGLIPQAPIHTQALVVLGRPRAHRDDDDADDDAHADVESVRGAAPDVARREVPVAVVEQRVSNLAQGALCLALLTRPFLHVLSLIPRGASAPRLASPRVGSPRF